MAILSLLAKLGLDKTGFDAGLADATKRANQFGTDLKSQLAGAFTIGAVVAFGREILQTGDEIKEMGEQLRITNKEAQEFALAAKLGGTDVGGFTAQFLKLRGAMADALNGKENKLEKFGISVADIAKMKPAEAWTRMAKAIDETGLSADRAEKMVDIFGKGAAKAVTSMGDLYQAKNGVLMFSDKEIYNMGLVNDGMIRIAASAKVLGLRLATLVSSGLIPAPVVKLLEKLGGGGAKPTIDENQILADNSKKEELEKTDDRVRKLTGEADDINERTRISQLTKEERLNELLEERAEIQRQLTLQLGEEANAVLALAKAKIDSEVHALNSKSTPKSKSRNGIEESAFGRIGAFTGAASNAAQPQRQVELLSAINQVLSVNGIVVRDVTR